MIITRKPAINNNTILEIRKKRTYITQKRLISLKMYNYICY